MRDIVVCAAHNMRMSLNVASVNRNRRGFDLGWLCSYWCFVMIVLVCPVKVISYRVKSDHAFTTRLLDVYSFCSRTRQNIVTTSPPCLVLRAACYNVRMYIGVPVYLPRCACSLSEITLRQMTENGLKQTQQWLKAWKWQSWYGSDSPRDGEVGPWRGFILPILGPKYNTKEKRKNTSVYLHCLFEIDASLCKNVVEHWWTLIIY